MYVRFSATPPAGELPVHANSGSGRPFAVIDLSRGCEVSVSSGEDCDRLIRAAVRAKAMLEKIGTPHEFTPMAGDEHRCDACGDLEDADHWKPGDAAAAVLAQSIAAGTPVILDEDEALPDCARPGCGHPEAMHTQQRFGEPIATGPCANCTCDTYLLPVEAPAVTS